MMKRKGSITKGPTTPPNAPVKISLPTKAVNTGNFDSNKAEQARRALTKGYDLLNVLQFRVTEKKIDIEELINKHRESDAAIPVDKATTIKLNAKEQEPFHSQLQLEFQEPEFFFVRASGLEDLPCLQVSATSQFEDSRYLYPIKATSPGLPPYFIAKTILNAKQLEAFLSKLAAMKSYNPKSRRAQQEEEFATELAKKGNIFAAEVLADTQFQDAPFTIVKENIRFKQPNAVFIGNDQAIDNSTNQPISSWHKIIRDEKNNLNLDHVKWYDGALTHIFTNIPFFGPVDECILPGGHTFRAHFNKLGGLDYQSIEFASHPNTEYPVDEVNYKKGIITFSYNDGNGEEQLTISKINNKWSEPEWPKPNSPKRSSSR